MKMQDKNGTEIKLGNTCVSHDRYGGKWTGVIVDSIDERLYFHVNYKTTLHDYWSKELEVIENSRGLKALLFCNPIVHGFKGIIFKIRHWYNNKYKRVEFKDRNGEVYY